MSQVKRTDVVEFANNFLGLHKYKDYGPMGLQFSAHHLVSGIASAVSITKEVIEKADEAGCNTLVVHHGLFWNTEPRTVDERMKDRIRALNDKNMSVLAYHLALDAHPEIGNNINVVRGLGVKNPVPFAEIGWGGEIEDIYLNPYEAITKMYPGKPVHFFGTKQGGGIKKVCAITGAGGNFIYQAKQEGYDLFLTGEAEEPSKALAEELGIHFVAAGHYETEKSGVQALGQYLANTFDVPYAFIEDENPV